MKRFAAILMVLVLMLGVFSACGQENEPSGETSEPPTEPTSAATEPAETEPAGEEEPAAENTVDLMGLYTVTDPEGVEYDERVALYMPVLESDEHYADGCRYVFTVFYGLEGKGVYMYNVETYETEEQAAAYAESTGTAADGTAVVSESDASFFAAMESFIPDLDTYISNNMASGMMELE